MNKIAIVLMFVLGSLVSVGKVHAQEMPCSYPLKVEVDASSLVTYPSADHTWANSPLVAGSKHISLGIFNVTAVCDDIDIHGIYLTPMINGSRAGGVYDKKDQSGNYIKVQKVYDSLQLVELDGSSQIQIGNSITDQSKISYGFFYQNQAIHFAKGETKRFQLFADISSNPITDSTWIEAFVTGYFAGPQDTAIPSASVFSQVPFGSHGFLEKAEIPGVYLKVISNTTNATSTETKNTTDIKVTNNNTSITSQEKNSTSFDSSRKTDEEKISVSDKTSVSVDNNTFPVKKISFWSRVKNFFRRIFY